MRACMNGHSEVVNELIQARADLWRSDRRQWTPLCYALGSGELELARGLLLQDKRRAEGQKVIVHRLKTQLIEYCEENAGEGCASELQKELDEGGFLAMKCRRV